MNSNTNNNPPRASRSHGSQESESPNNQEASRRSSPGVSTYEPARTSREPPYPTPSRPEQSSSTGASKAFSSPSELEHEQSDSAGAYMCLEEHGGPSNHIEQAGEAPSSPVDLCALQWASLDGKVELIFDVPFPYDQLAPLCTHYLVELAEYVRDTIVQRHKKFTSESIKDLQESSNRIKDILTTRIKAQVAENRKESEKLKAHDPNHAVRSSSSRQARSPRMPTSSRAPEIPLSRAAVSSRVPERSSRADPLSSRMAALNLSSNPTTSSSRTPASRPHRPTRVENYRIVDDGSIIHYFRTEPGSSNSRPTQSSRPQESRHGSRRPRGATLGPDPRLGSPNSDHLNTRGNGSHPTLNYITYHLDEIRFNMGTITQDLDRVSDAAQWNDASGAHAHYNHLQEELQLAERVYEIWMEKLRAFHRGDLWDL